MRLVIQIRLSTKLLDFTETMPLTGLCIVTMCMWIKLIFEPAFLADWQ